MKTDGPSDHMKNLMIPLTSLALQASMWEFLKVRCPQGSIFKKLTYSLRDTTPGLREEKAFLEVPYTRMV